MLNYLNANKYKIEDYLKCYFSQIYEYSFSGEVYLLSGAILDIIEDKEPKDLDFVVISSSNEDILNFININNFKYSKNSFGGCKICYNSLSIDIWNNSDLSECIQYNLDGLFYNIKTGNLTSIGFLNAVESGELVLVNKDKKHINSLRESERFLKLSKIIKYYKQKKEDL